MACTLHYRDHVAIITINNPQKLGALTKDMLGQLGHNMREANAREDTYITLLAGTGRFFSAGVSVHEPWAQQPPDTAATGAATPHQVRQRYVHHMSDLLDLAQTFYTHRKLLITALNGPVVGLPAALISHSDFIYATPQTYLLAPFNSIGIVVEGGATRSLVQRMGLGLAKEAMLMARRITVEELGRVGFVNGVFDVSKGAGEDGKMADAAERFTEKVFIDICHGRLGGHLSSTSMLKTKQIMGRVEEVASDANAVREFLGGVEAFERGDPQEQLRRLSQKEKRHKL